jgi:formylglycine-generating enzyme required for sulfatase activity
MEDGGFAAPSCIGLAENCGPNGDEPCCASPRVRGGTFYRGYDGVTTSPNNYTTKAYPATVSYFRFDRFEITVGRFRKFVTAYSQNMIAAGAGKNPNNANDLGWDKAWNVNLPSDATTLVSAVKCFSPAPAWTWTDSVGTNETRPMNCIDWYTAFAFCIWDGGRLPTEAEWNYAAAGGNEQRIYPWGKPPPDCSYANFGGAHFPATACVLPGTGATNNVGSESPKGDGKWGQTDLAGNVAEWVLDWYANPYPQTPCLNCANMTVTSARVARGMGYTDFAQVLLSSMRNINGPSSNGYNLGVRCARNP